MGENEENTSSGVKRDPTVVTYTELGTLRHLETLFSCELCGATVLAENIPVHDEWHRTLLRWVQSML